MESNAGENAFASDQKYAEAGAKVVSRVKYVNLGYYFINKYPERRYCSNFSNSKILFGNYQPLYNYARL